jgi:hypothetical protein
VRPVLIDADAFLLTRSVSLLALLRRAPSFPRPALMTEWIARYELASLTDLRRELEAEGFLRVESIERRTEADRRYRGLRNERLDKGEAEAIAWVLGLPPGERPIFVSHDRAALMGGRRHGIVCGDVMDLVVEAVESAVLLREDARAALSVWEDPQQRFFRPRDFTTFDETYARRLAKIKSR